MRPPLLLLPLLLAASPASADEAPAPPSPGVQAVPDAASNPGSAPAPAPPVKSAAAAGGDDVDPEEPSGPHGPAMVAALETLSAGLHGVAGALVSVSVANASMSGAGQEDDRRDLALGGALLAGPFLAGWGAHWVGAYHDRPGSFWAALGGAAVGEALGFGATRLLDEPSRLQEHVFPIGVAAVGAAAGSLLTSTAPTAGARPAGAPPAVTGGLSADPDGRGLRLTLAGTF